MIRPLPIWKLAGMDMQSYRQLSWPEKRKLIVRHQGIPIRSCTGHASSSGSYLYDRWVASTPGDPLKKMALLHPVLVDFFEGRMK